MSKAVTPDEVKEFHRLYEQCESCVRLVQGRAKRMRSYGAQACPERDD